MLIEFRAHARWDHAYDISIICRFLGDISYPLYMTHYVLVYFYVAWVSRRKGITLSEAWPYALLTFAGAVVLAYGSSKWYDEPVRGWLRRRLWYSRRE